MDLKLDEQRLLSDFRHLAPAGQQELLDYAAFLVKKSRNPEEGEPEAPDNQCPLEREPQERPEAAREPIFTE